MPDSSRAPSRAVDPQPDASVAGLVAGEKSAFRAVYAQFDARLYTFLLRLTHDEAEARDLTQDVWLRLASHATRLRPDTDVGAWLFTVARNRYYSRRRARLFDRQRLFAWGLLGTPDGPPSPLLAAATGELACRLEAALAALAVHYREVLMLHAIEGFSTKDIARMLDIDEATVRKRLSRARAGVRALAAEAL